MLEEQIERFASRVTTRLAGKIDSLVTYPHPFTNGGLVIVFSDDAGFAPDLIAEVYRCSPPPVTLYCLRRRELFQLSCPGVFGWPNPLEEKPLLAYWLRFKGKVVYGRDIREEIALPTEPKQLLENQLQRCQQFIRNWMLDQFRRRNYAGIVKEMDRQTNCLMATALLAHGEWDVAPPDVPGRFEVLFDDPQPGQTWKEISALTLQMAANPDQSRGMAMEAVWLFEKALHQIGRHAS